MKDLSGGGKSHFLALAIKIAGFSVLIFTSLIYFVSPYVFNPSVNAASEFKTQIVTVTIPSGETSIDILAPDSFEEVDPITTIAILSSATNHAMGRIAESDQYPDDISMYVELVDGETLRATRASAASVSTTAQVLLIEYSGSANGSNAFIVHDREVHAWSSGDTTDSYGPIAGIDDANKIVVFGAGSANPNTSRAAYDRGDVRAHIDGSNNVVMNRGDGVGAITSSHQVVEFTGSNWTIQTGEDNPARLPAGVDIVIGDIEDISTAWVYFTNSTNSPNLDERGFRAMLTGPTTLNLQEHHAASASNILRWYVISNPELSVQSGSADNQFQTLRDATIPFAEPVEDMTRSFAWVTGATNGGGQAHPRTMWQSYLSDESTITLARGRQGQNFDYHYQVIEFPAASENDSASTSIKHIFPKNYSMDINSQDACTTSGNVFLTIKAENTSRIAISNRKDFNDASWIPFNGLYETEWAMPEDEGLQYIFVMYESPTADRTIAQYDEIIYDSQTHCGRGEEIAASYIAPSRSQWEIQFDASVFEGDESQYEVPLCELSCDDLDFDYYIVDKEGKKYYQRHAKLNIDDIGLGKVQHQVIGFEESETLIRFDDIESRISLHDCNKYSIHLNTYQTKEEYDIRFAVKHKGLIVDDFLLWGGKPSPDDDMLRTVPITYINNVCEAAE